MFSAYTFRIIPSWCIVPFIICSDLLYLFLLLFAYKTCFAWYDIRYNCLPLISTWLVYLFPTFHIYFICVFVCEMFESDNLCLLIEELILFTFRVMIERYLLIPVFLLIFISGWISCWLFFTFVTVYLFCWFTELIMLGTFPTLLGSPIYLLSFIISWPLMFVTIFLPLLCAWVTFIIQDLYTWTF
jgi:hypothetical protein